MAYDPRNSSRVPALPLEPDKLAPYILRAGRGSTVSPAVLRSALGVLRTLREQHGEEAADQAWTAATNHIAQAEGNLTAVKRADRALADIRDGRNRGGRVLQNPESGTPRMLSTYLPQDVIDALDGSHQRLGANSRNALIERYIRAGLAADGVKIATPKPAKAKRTRTASATAAAS